jgi:hypothetical protein
VAFKAEKGPADQPIKFPVENFCLNLTRQAFEVKKMTNAFLNFARGGGAKFYFFMEILAIFF